MFIKCIFWLIKQSLNAQTKIKHILNHLSLTFLQCKHLLFYMILVMVIAIRILFFFFYHPKNQSNYSFISWYLSCFNFIFVDHFHQSFYLFIFFITQKITTASSANPSTAYITYNHAPIHSNPITPSFYRPKKSQQHHQQIQSQVLHQL